MTTATTRLLDALRAANGNCTDYRAGKLLGVSTSAVSRWRVGIGHMSDANVIEACHRAGLEHRTWQWRIRIGAEREKGPDGEMYRDMLVDIERMERSQEPRKGHLVYTLIHGISGRAAAIVAAFTLTLLGVFSPQNTVRAAQPMTAQSAPANMHYAQRARRRLRAWLRFLFVFPAHAPRVAT